MEGIGRTLERTAEERVDVIDGENLIGGDPALEGGAGDALVQASDNVSSNTTGVCSHLHVVEDEQLQRPERDCPKPARQTSEVVERLLRSQGTELFLWHMLEEEGSILADKNETEALRKQGCCISSPGRRLSPRMNTSVSSSMESSLKLQHLYRAILKL